MPTYDYRCKDCGHQFEVFQLMSADPLKECPVCAGAVERLIGGGVGLVFKGSGFYITDYKNPKNGDIKDSKPKTESTAPKESKSKTEAKSSD